MSSGEFFVVFFNNLPLFLTWMFACCLALYLSVRKVAPAAYLDPLHFYFTFTFGTSYGIIIGLYALGLISDFLFYTVFGYAVLFIVSFRALIVRSPIRLFKAVNVLLIPKGSGIVEFYVLLCVYILLLVFLVLQIGLGITAETNRFEQNRGYGAFVRVADGVRVFVIAYLTLLVCKQWLTYRRLGIKYYALIFFILLIAVLSSAVNGAKFAMLEALYSSFVAIAIFHRKAKFRLIYAGGVFAIALVFALFVLSINLEKAGFDKDSQPTYMDGGSVLVERLMLRVLGNADKYFLTLPNDVIDKLETDALWVRFLSPVVGSTMLSKRLGYTVNNFNVGRQALLYYFPDHEISGGPTSHFDLFAYKYFGVYFGWVWVLFSGFVFACIVSLSRLGTGNLYFTAIVTTLWLRGLPMLLEPSVGFAYILDVVIIFSLLKLVCCLLPRKTDVEK